MIMGVSMTSIGQNSDSLKFQSGNRNFELQISPFADNPISMNEFKFRYFNSPNSAFRISGNISQSSSSSITQQAIDSLDQLELKEKSSSFSLRLSPGYEHHFAGTNRFSPYIGGGIDLGFSRTSLKSDFQVLDESFYVRYVNGQAGGEGPTQKEYVSIGANAFAGFDYYITKGIYLGTELGLGLTHYNYLGVKLKSDVDGFEEPEAIKQGGSTTINKRVNGSLRLGFLF